jgi:hypothetical protein
MPVLDFREIPEAHLATGHQDRFELFARDFLEYLGYGIVESPSRGSDGGKDLIVLDVRKGVGGESSIRWLVSCKHKAHSGNSVGVDDELNILERTKANQGDGFLGFFSTLPSSGLQTRLTELKGQIETDWFDHEKIESRLLRSSSGIDLARRYFAKSIRTWEIENPRPAALFEGSEPLKCEYCGKVLLDPKGQFPSNRRSIISFWRKKDPSDEYSQETTVVDMYWSCKGHCDNELEAQRYAQGLLFDGWEDITDVCIPLVYLRWIMTSINNARDGNFSAEALEKLKTFMIAVFHFVSRTPTKQERDTVRRLMELPPFFGGPFSDY